MISDSGDAANLQELRRRLVDRGVGDVQLGEEGRQLAPLVVQCQPVVDLHLVVDGGSTCTMRQTGGSAAPNVASSGLEIHWHRAGQGRCSPG